jgi:hypothetical protein
MSVRPDPARRDAASADVPDPRRHAAARALLDAHLFGEVADQPWVQAVEHDPRFEAGSNIPRWYVRFGCDGRDAATIYFDLHQRSLHYEVYFLPDPPANRAALHAALLRWNHDSYGAHFSLGPDGDTYLVGRVLLEHLDRDELDRIIGSIYALVERCFASAATIAFGRRSDA